jgi:3-dehydroquinate synthase
MVGPLAAEHELPRRAVIVTDTSVEALYAVHVQSALSNYGFTAHIVSIPPGEDQKSLGTVQRVYDRLHELQCGRDTTVIAVGGGVVGDLAGFVAATYHRGIPYVQVPTTLLAQVDSSVGGKTGVNLPYGKNLIGAFYQPRFVCIDVRTLATLPERELRSGMAEVIKYGAILDRDLFGELERNIDALLQPDLNLFGGIIERCCALKASVVAQDERESGYREILNFGHTVGHAIEASAGYAVLTHGEAITWGMTAEAWMSVDAGGLPAGDADRLNALLARLSPPAIPAGIDPDMLYRAMYADKKVRSGKLRFSLLDGIGKTVFGSTPDEAVVKRSLHRLFTGINTIHNE